MLRLRLAVGMLLLRLAAGIPSVTPETSTNDPSSTKSSRTFQHPSGQVQQPNIIIILADDLGFNDLSFHGANQIPTPNIDAIGYNGIILNSHYVSAMCTPSRSALMTGKYPIHTGMQHLVLLEAEPRGLPLTEKMLPEHLRNVGYKTHALGKWHLGYYQKEYSPTYRGFDTHFGYWNGYQDYYDHEAHSSSTNFSGFDMRRNMSVARDSVGKYSTDLFTDEAIRLIDDHDTESPMFLYMAHLAPHAGNPDDPLQAPDEEIAKFSYIDDPERRIYAAMVSKLDWSVGEVVAALRRRGMLENSIILFMADNGAPTQGIHANTGSNYPLRGIKDSAWEGGVRGAAAIWSPLINKPRRISNQLMSIVDWLPTFCSVAGVNVNDVGTIDGVDVWDALINNKTSPRSEVLINIDDIDNYAAIRRGDFKYVIGHTASGDGWYGDPGQVGPHKFDVSSSDDYPKSVLRSKTGIAISGVITAKQIMALRNRRKDEWSSKKEENTGMRLLSVEEIRSLRSNATVVCTVKEEDRVDCNPVESPCLFNIKEDPCEYINIAAKRPVILATLEEALMKFRVTAIPAANVPSDPLANPDLWEGVWTDWKDPDPSISSDEESESVSSAPISGTTVAVVAVIVGLSIVASIVLIAIKCVDRSNSLPQPEQNNLTMTNYDPITTNDEQRSLKISTENEKLTRLNAMKDLAKSID